MLDKLEKSLNLIADLKAAAPFEVELTPELFAYLRAERVGIDLAPQQIVRDVSYAGDEGGILCDIGPEDGRGRLLVSLTHLRLRRSLPFAGAVLD